MINKNQRLKKGGMMNKYDYLKNLDTDRLKNMLQQESFLSDEDDYNVELIQQILSILDGREPVLEDIDVDAAYELFQQEILPDLNADEMVSNESPKQIPALFRVPKRKIGSGIRIRKKALTEPHRTD